MFAFRFMATRTFLAEIQQIPYLTLKIQGQGHDENRLKSNQVIYRSGPTTMPKMKVIQKLSHEQESVGGGAGANQHKNMKSSPVYRADFIGIEWPLWK